MINDDKKIRSSSQHSSNRKEDERSRKGTENKNRVSNLTPEERRRGGEHGGSGK